MNRKYIHIVMAVLVAAVLFITGTAFAGEGWQMELVAKVAQAENKMAVGQMTDATDGIDGYYDIPALLGGEIMAYIPLEGKRYWRDIRAACTSTCVKKWEIVVESVRTGEEITLDWDGSSIPEGVNLVLVDGATGQSTNMKSAGAVTYTNTGKRRFTIEAGE